MKIEIVEYKTTYPNWAVRLLLIYAVIGMSTVIFFSNDFIKNSIYLNGVINYLAVYFPGINVSVNSFGFVRKMYLCVMLLSVAITFVCLFFSRKIVPYSVVFGVGATKFIFRSIVAAFLATMLFNLIYFIGIPHSEFSISKGRVLDILFNYSKIGMALSGSVLFLMIVIFYYFMVMELVFFIKCIRGDFK